jgi:hypothetical protein
VTDERRIKRGKDAGSPDSRKLSGLPRTQHSRRSAAVRRVRGAVSLAPADTVATIAAVSAAKIAWLTTVVLCLVAAVLLLVNGYTGYFGVVIAVGAAAAVNLT